jgi:hypothetical protein
LAACDSYVLGYFDTEESEIRSDSEYASGALFLTFEVVDRKIDYMHNQAFGVETNSGGIAIKDSGGTQRVTKDLNPFFHSDWDWEGRRPSPERTFFVVCHSCYTLCESIPGNTEPHSPICGQWPIDRAQRQGLIHQTPSRASGGCDSGKGVLSLSRPRPKFGRQWILWLDPVCRQMELTASWAKLQDMIDRRIYNKVAYAQGNGHCNQEWTTCSVSE